MARDSAAVAGWTTVSRLTGFARAIAVAAVLGPTYLGNTYQAVNGLPNLVFELLTGNLLATLLVPAFVRFVDRRDRASLERVVGAFLGLALATFAVIAGLAVLAGELLLQLVTLGVEDAGVAGDQRRVGFLLLLMVVPQVLLYAVAGVGGAVSNAHGRFSLPAAAPALENVGILATLAVVALAFGTGATLEDVGMAELLVLGLGSTAAVGLHAGAQWWGARRVGVSMRPRLGWRDTDMNELLRAGAPSLGYSSLNALRWLAVLVVANAVPGGVVAFTLAINFFYLPIAIGARPVAIALLPRLARLHQARTPAGFRDEWVHGAALALFVTVPAAVAYLVLSTPLARAASLGEMATPDGIALVSVSLAALAAGIVGEALFVMGTHASYARGDARSPFRAMVLKTLVSMAGMAVVAWRLEGAALLLGLGLVLSLADIAGAADLWRRVEIGLPRGSARLAPAVGRALVASILMAVPAFLVAAGVAGAVGGAGGEVLAVAAATLVGAATFLAVQRSLRSPELGLFVSALRRGGARPAGER